MNEPGLLRIGELSRRSGVSPELLRAWERRYGLLQPTRSAGGLRLYSTADLERVVAMRRHLADGLAAAEAAALATQTPAEPSAASLAPAETKRALGEALARFDEPAAQAVLDTLLAGHTLDSALADSILPYLRELGDRWARGEISVAQEHFASSVLRGRLSAVARGWGRGLGPRVLLACAPGEQHDLGLIAFGLALRARGWRIVYLGADTPLATIADASRAADAAYVVVTAVSAERFREHTTELAKLAKEQRLCLGGAGATSDLGIDALILSGDPVAEAERLTAIAAG